MRLALRRCGGAADLALLPQDLSRAATALAAHECHHGQTERGAYHRELHRRSAAVAFAVELLAAPRPNASVHGDGTHPGVQGHAAMAASVEKTLLSRCHLLVPPVAPAPPPEQSCHFGHRIAELVSGTRGFAFVDPGNSRTPGYAATEQGSSLTLGLRPRHAGGFLSLAFESG